MRDTLANNLDTAVKELSTIMKVGLKVDGPALREWMKKVPTQLVMLAAKINWTEAMEAAYTKGDLAPVEQHVVEVTSSAEPIFISPPNHRFFFRFSISSPI